MTKANMAPCTLFFQDVALLKIVHWKPIEGMMIFRNMKNEVFYGSLLCCWSCDTGTKVPKIVVKCL